MAEVFRGTIASGTEGRTGTSLPQKIVSFSLVNKSGGANTVNATVGGVSVFSGLIANGEMYETHREIMMNPNDDIEVTASAALDYYFTLFNILDGGGNVN